LTEELQGGFDAWDEDDRVAKFHSVVPIQCDTVYCSVSCIHSSNVKSRVLWGLTLYWAVPRTNGAYPPFSENHA
jgi:hypothetical protein